MPRRMFLLGLPPRTLFESLATLALLLAVTRRARTVPVVLLPLPSLERSDHELGTENLNRERKRSCVPVPVQVGGLVGGGFSG